MVEYTHAQDDFAVFTPVVGVSDPIALLNNERGWVYRDDLGYARDARGEVIYSPWNSFYIRTWSPLGAVPYLGNAKPIMAFSAQYDTRVSSSQTIRLIRALETSFGPTAPVYMIEHENVGPVLLGAPARADPVRRLPFGHLVRLLGAHALGHVGGRADRDEHPLPVR